MKHHATKKHSFWIYIFSLLLVISLTSCMSPKVKEIMMNGEHYKPLNLLPMYGAEYEPYIKKTEAQKQADEEFIKTEIASLGSREKAAKYFAAWGWSEWKKGDKENAMRRFNQSWLLNPNYYMPYWGFGTLEGDTYKAATYYEKSLSLIGENDEDKQKPRLLTDTSRVYSSLGRKLSDETKSKEFFQKANALLSEAITLDPKYVNAYNAWALSLYFQGNYQKSWESVKKSRELGRNFSANFISALTQKMPEPR